MSIFILSYLLDICYQGRKMAQIILSILLLSFLYGWPLLAYASEAPKLMLAKVYETRDSLSGYVVTEKFDGVRGYWNGEKMLSRSGRFIPIPEWLKKQMPDYVIEGELWLGYGRFAEMSGLIHSENSNDELWNMVSFKVFDAPQVSGSYLQRMSWLHDHIVESSNLQIVSGFRVKDQDELDRHLAVVIESGGEGLMLNLADASYQTARTSALLKYKPEFDDEAKVIGYSAGHGKYEGMLGALVVEWRNGRVFKIGSGLTDDMRENPPALGAKITFTYSGYTSTGLPRFARYLRPYKSL
jgi:DNA ligase 1